MFCESKFEFLKCNTQFKNSNYTKVFLNLYKDLRKRYLRVKNVLYSLPKIMNFVELEAPWRTQNQLLCAILFILCEVFQPH